MYIPHRHQIYIIPFAKYLWYLIIQILKSTQKKHSQSLKYSTIADTFF